MSTRTNRQWSEAHAREVLARGERRGLSTAALARELGVSAQRIYWWRKRLAEAGAPPPSRFAEVTVARELPGQRPSSPAFTVQTRSGQRVEVWPGFDPAELARLLAVVEGLAC